MLRISSSRHARLTWDAPTGQFIQLPPCTNLVLRHVFWFDLQTHENLFEGKEIIEN